MEKAYQHIHKHNHAALKEVGEVSNKRAACFFPLWAGEEKEKEKTHIDISHQYTGV